MKVTTLILSALFVAGCSSNQSENPSPKEREKTQTQTTPKYTAAPPKSTFKPKAVQAENYTSEYMYPSNRVQPTLPAKEKTDEENNVGETMTKEECIAMIGEEKYQKYTEMFSGETGAIKRCTILKAMQNR
ncbi:hypothetical protein [Sulfurovum mangrovi]|uniref:hypothetical protein n=1 Tax=Sulfurovum mangrovi TaxID=2893889 RepID=UPI001E56734F|nr:hypothetical protein [Sulfurovum mangrovi]UFH59915.1 hypothetical protein LN246_03485 [Sulfurovum mangrovi]